MPHKNQMTDYEKQRMKRIEENKARMKAIGLDKTASSFNSSIPVSQNPNRKGKRKVGLEDDDDDEYKPNDDDEPGSSSQSDDQDDDDDDYNEFSTKPKPKKSTPSKKNTKLSGNSSFVDEDEALMKAIALSLQDSQGFLDVASKTPPQSSDANASSVENTERKQISRKDDSGKRKKKLFTSRVQMTEDELILHFFQFDEAGKGGINLWDLQRVAASHDFTWKDEEMEHMIQFFDTDGDGKLSLEDFTKIVERCNMKQV